MQNAMSVKDDFGKCWNCQVWELFKILIDLSGVGWILDYLVSGGGL